MAKDGKRTQVVAIIKGGGINHEQWKQDFLDSHPDGINERNKMVEYDVEDHPDYIAIFCTESTPEK